MGTTIIRKRALIFMSIITWIVLTASFAITIFHTETEIRFHTPPLEIEEARYVAPMESQIQVDKTDIVRIEESPNYVVESDPDEDYAQIPSNYNEEYSTVGIPQAQESDLIIEPDGYSAEYFESAGVIYTGDRKYTWYSQNVLPGGGLDIPGRHVENGFVVDGEGRIVVASADLPYGSEVEIPFGSGIGIVLDTGYLEPGQIDVYTDF